MKNDNEKLMKQIINKKINMISNISELEKTLCKLIKDYHIEKINNETYNLEEILDFYKKDMELQEFSKNTIKNKMYLLKHFCNFVKKDINEITVLDIKSYLNFKKQTVKSSTINGILDNLKAFFTWSVEEGYIENNPVKKVKKLKQAKRI